MKFILYLLILICCANQAFGQAFITTWKTDNPGLSANNQIIIQTTGGGYSYGIAWEKVGNAAINGTIPGPITEDYTITFPSAGNYRVSINGAFPQIYFPYDSNSIINGDLILKSDHFKLLTVEQWGSNVWRSMKAAFQGCNLTIPAKDAPNLTQVTDMSYMFLDADSFNQPIEHWDVSNVTNMDLMFFDADSFNQPLEAWNVSHVTRMLEMFSGANNFNKPLEAWDVSNVEIMSDMLSAPSFNQPLGRWNIRSAQGIGIGGSSMDMKNYDQTLIGWAAQNVQYLVILRADGLKYCAGDSARLQLITKKRWYIHDDKKDSLYRLPAPEVSLTQPICYGSTGAIKVIVQNSNDQYSFDNGVTFQSSNIFTGLGAGTYPVMLNRTGCSSTTKPIVINPPLNKSPTPKISGSGIVCPNVTAVDYSASIDQYAYTWFINGGTLQSQQNNKVKVNWGPSNFKASVKAIGTDQHNCPTDTAIFQVKIQIKLKPSQPRGMDSVCYNFRAGVPYQTSYTNGSVYTWLTDGGIISDGQNTSRAKIDWAGVGQFKLWIKEENQTSTDYCEGNSDTLKVNVFKDLAAITMNFVSVDYKDDKTVQIRWDASLLERVSDLVIVSRRIASSDTQWEVVATLQKNVQSFLDQNVQTGQNIYEYKVEGFNKCDEGLQTVIHNTIKLDGDKDEEQELIDLFWNDYNGWDGTERYEVWRKLDTDTTYRLIDITPGGITNYTGKHGADGFIHTLRIKAKKKSENTISWSNAIQLKFDNPIDFIPNVITPSGDGKNDYFFIPKLNLYPENYLRIYDRWGMVVYESKNYENDWNAQGLSGGIYYYILRLDSNNSILKGWVQVVR